MQNAIAIASVLAPVYLVLGLSLLMYAKVWKGIMERWEKDHYGLFSIMFGVMLMGLVMLQMYHSWELNVWVLVTIMGWAAFIKGVSYFLAPGPWITAILKMGSKTWMMYIGGVCSLALGVFLGYYAYIVK
ncbi:MAG: hypothetical protein WCT53_02030 [Candidatus Gracilibacteria bacterium]